MIKRSEGLPPKSYKGFSPSISSGDAPMARAACDLRESSMSFAAWKGGKLRSALVLDEEEWKFGVS